MSDSTNPNPPPTEKVTKPDDDKPAPFAWLMGLGAFGVAYFIGRYSIEMEYNSGTKGYGAYFISAILFVFGGFCFLSYFRSLVNRPWFSGVAAFALLLLAVYIQGWYMDYFAHHH